MLVLVEVYEICFPIRLWIIVCDCFLRVVVIPSYTYYMWSQAKERAKKRWSIELYKLVDRIIGAIVLDLFIE